MTQYNQQYHEHGGKDIPNGKCEFYHCNYRGIVKFNADYMYVCPTHQKELRARNFMNSKKGTANYNASKIKNLRQQITELEAAQPALDEAAAKAKFKYHLVKGKQ